MLVIEEMMATSSFYFIMLISKGERLTAWILFKNFGMNKIFGTHLSKAEISGHTFGLKYTQKSSKICK